MITCRLETGQAFPAMQELFKHELARKHERSTTELLDEHGAVFVVTAQDTVALRAALNSITSILGMYEKTNGAH